ncbi:MAG: MFS transporter [Planctomycetes bacterium]|nr:MFS transporter [Planctomycetota bacterium]
MKSKLLKRGYISLICTQFFGAANDNLLKGVLTFMVIDGVWRGKLGDGGQGLVGLLFTLPFILLSGYAGQFADRNSKRYVSVLVKVIEIPIAAIALLGFWTGNLWITLGALIALSCQSAFFGPAKYGMIPELVDEGDLSRANGFINMMTNIAVIAGTLLAGEIADRYNPLPSSDGSVVDALPWLPGVAMVLLACAGLIAVIFLVKLEPGDKNLRYTANPFKTYIAAIKEMSQTPLLMVMLAWGYFYLLAGLALFIVPEYTVVLNIDRSQASVLMGILGLSIGLGSVVAGLISGHKIEPRLIPIGALGLSVFFFLLGIVKPSVPPDPTKLQVALSNVSLFLLGAGFFAGFYIVPLQALLQKLSPDDERGRFLGTANGVSFMFLAAASLLYWVIKPLFGNAPQRIFILSAIMMLVGAAFFLFKLRRLAFTTESK